VCEGAVLGRRRWRREILLALVVHDLRVGDHASVEVDGQPCACTIRAVTVERDCRAGFLRSTPG
jgi:hypothetical protein